MGLNKEEITGGKKGMNRDVHPSQLQSDSYTFMLNGNYEDTDGNFVQLQNEHSNILCSGFKEGYKVVGHIVDKKNDKVYFFLTNPDTGLSEIGCIKNITCIDDAVAMQVDCGCDVKVILETPLEDQTQVPLCNYETIIEDCESTPCLNFDICFPFKQGNIQLKQEKCGDTLYFTDAKNPPRYIQLDNLEIYNEQGFSTDCDDPIISECLDCDKMRIFPLYKKPCLKPVSIQTGGNLQAGVYEVLIAYSDELGNELSPYYSITQPIPIFDLNNNILDQSLLGYETTFGIRLVVEDLDQSFSNYKAAVIFRNGLDGAVRYFVEGIHLISDDSITLSSLRNKAETTQQNLFVGRTFYETSEGMTSGNGFLFQFGLKARPIINLQPVVNLMGSFAKWTTVLAKEDLYQDSVNSALYKSYMRDEVYPFGIKFFTDQGEATPVFPLIPRPPKDTEIQDINTLGVPTTLDSITKCAPDCFENPRDKRWQYFNTAEETGLDCEFTGETQTITIEQEVECVVLDGDDFKVIDTYTGSFFIPNFTGSLDIVQFLTENYDNILDPSSALSSINVGSGLDDIREIMDDSDDDYPAETCLPDEQGDCTYVLTGSKLLPFTIGEIDPTDADGDGNTEYIITPQFIPPANIQSPTTGSCNRVDKDLVGNPLVDTDFINNFLLPTSTVYQTVPRINYNCIDAILLPRVPGSTTSTGLPVYLENFGGFSIGDISDLLFTGLDDQGTPTNVPFLSGLHDGAIWYKGEFAFTEDNLLIQPSELGTCEFTDDLNTSTEVRISVFDACGDTNAIDSYIVDLSAPTNLLINKSNYTTDDVYITVEPALRRDVEYEIELQNASADITLTGTSGTADISVGGTPYTATFNSDLTTTASDFVTLHAAAIFAATGTTVTSLGPVLTFQDPDPLPALSIVNVIVDLNGTIAPGEIDIDIDGNSFTQQYNVDLTTTASDFVAAHQPAIEALGMTVSSIGAVIELRGSETQFNNTVVNTLVGTLTGSITQVGEIFITTPPCGCFNLTTKFLEIEKYEIEFQDLTFYKVMEYDSECEVEVPKYDGCKPSPYTSGLFSYWESTENYPCNNELYDSSTLQIKPADIPTALQTEFEDNYVQQTVPGTPDLDIDGNYIFKTDGSTPLVDFKDRPIRHYKFPCNTINPFMNTQSLNSFAESLIFPIGFDLKPEVISAFLDIAVTNGLISQEDRDKITKYEIYRGDRRTHKSIVAKGLAYDMYTYTEPTLNNRTIYYPNFPYNDLGTDELHQRLHPFSGRAQNKFTFHSPDTHLSRPVLGTEVKFEGFQFGKSEGRFVQVEDHPEWVILGQPAYTTATLLASAEIAIDTTFAVIEIASNSNISGPLSSALYIAAAVVAAGFRFPELRQKWLQIFTDLGKPENFAYYYTSYGFYNNFLPNDIDLDQVLRSACTSAYLTEGNISVTEETTGITSDINNTDREKSVYFSLGAVSDNLEINYPSVYYTYDSDYNKNRSSRFISSDDGCTDKRTIKNVASPYVAFKNYVPDQYGRIDTINWLNTSFCGDLSEEYNCEPAFGGDIYISRFSWKRKIPMFLVDAVKQADLLPFAYSIHKNIPTLRYFADYEITDVTKEPLSSFFFPTNRTIVDDTELGLLDCLEDDFYVKPPSKFYLYYYGIPYFLVESEINSWLRYGNRELSERFYPQVKDYVKWTQEVNVSIREPNRFFYNPVYSLSPTLIKQFQLPETYDKETYDCINDLPNGVIYSLTDASENSLADPWLVFRPLDKYEFPTRYGKLIDLSVIQAGQLLGRFEDQVIMYNESNRNYRQTLDTTEIGDGALFTQNRPVEFTSTDLGYMGTQHRAMVSCEYGFYWVDAKRGHVFQYTGGDTPPVEITPGLRHWFKEHLPFNLLRSNIEGLTSLDLDNNFNGLGITMGWDSRYRRVFITKKDYRVREGCNTTITYEDCKFYNDLDEEISLLDDTYFEDCSWTIAYSPITQSWVSYYSFKPDYYITHQNYFQTGLNFSSDDTELGIWSHLLTNESYQVFYGKLHPWIVETPIKENFRNGLLHNVTYWLDVRKYWNRYDFAERDDLGFNKAWIYNNCKNSGQLNLIQSQPNNLRQKMDYPKYNSDSIDILATNKYKKWTFNHIYDITKNQNENIPIWLNDCSQIEKTLNPLAIKYQNTWKNKLQGDWFLNRLQQDQESRFKFILKWQEDKRNYFDG